MTDLILDARGLTKRYDQFVALKDVELSLGAHEIHALIGPNGAGKSTAFGILAGDLRATAGNVAYRGRDITRMAAWRRTRLGIARSFQIARVFTRFTVEENVRAAVLAARRRTWIFFRPEGSIETGPQTEQLLGEAGLAPLRGVLASGLSQGDRKRLEIAMALALEPEVLLLDEPTAGMSPVETTATVRLIRRLWEERGCAVLITEHDMSVVFELAQRITVLHRGQVLRSGSPEAISADPTVREVYLGSGDDA